MPDRIRPLLFTLFALCLLLGTAPGRAADRVWTDQSALEIPLEGWLLFPGQLLHPKDLTAEQIQTGIAVEHYVGLWPDIKAIQPFSNGVLTYRKTMHIEGLAGHTVFFRSRDFLRAAKIFINGEEWTEVGKVSSQEEDYRPSKSYIFKSFKAHADDLELVIQVADFSGAYGGIWAPIGLYGESSGIHRMQMDVLGFAGVLVTLVFMSIYFGFLYFMYRHRQSLIYAGIFLMTTGVFIFLTGELRIIRGAYDFLGYELHTRAEITFSILSSMTFLLFLGELFPQEFHRTFNRLFYAAGGCSLLSPLLMPIAVAEKFNLFLGIYLGLQFFYIMIASIRAVYARRVGARLWVIGTLFLTFTMLLDIGKYQSLTNLPNVSHLGLLIFTLVQSLVVIQQLSQDDRQKRHAYEQLAKVFYPHQLQKMMAGQILEHTMPQGMTQACVICFDVVSSSGLEHEKARNLFAKIFSKCHAAMMEGYEQESMIANGYRIKEVGDGFYCSVGFPFAVPVGKNPFDLSLHLAFRFVQIFDDIVQGEHLDRPIQCSVGIAYDTVEAYFADAGTKSYDIFGRAVILSNRYEDLRRTFFEKERQLNVIAVQDKVFQNLSREHQQSLQAFDLTDRSFKIRDDGEARSFYYWAGSRMSLAER